MGYAHWGEGTKEPRCLQPPRLFEPPQACYRSCGVHPDVHGASVWPKVPRLYIGDDSSKFEVAGGGTWPQDVEVKCWSHYAAIGTGSTRPHCLANGSFTPAISCRRICDPFKAPTHLR